MTTYEVFALFKRYIDEPDVSFIGDDECAFFLKLGYAEFRRFVSEIEPYVVAAQPAIINLNAATQYDLSQQGTTGTNIGTPSIMGPNPNVTFDGINWSPTGRLTRILKVLLVDPVTFQSIQEFELVSDISQLTQPWQAWLGSQTLIFTPGQSITGTILILYNQEQEIGLPNAQAGGVTPDQPEQSWFVPITVAGSVLINDHLHPFHDVIALMAYDQYAILDAADNSQVLRRLSLRKKELENYLMQRNFSGTSYVHNTPNPLSNLVRGG